MLAVAARADNIQNRIRPRRRDFRGFVPHGLGESGDFGGRFAFHPQRDEQRADLRGRRLAGHDEFHCLEGFFAG